MNENIENLYWERQVKKLCKKFEDNNNKNIGEYFTDLYFYN